MRIGSISAGNRDERFTGKTLHLRYPKDQDSVEIFLAQYLNAPVEPDTNDIHPNTATIDSGMSAK